MPPENRVGRDDRRDLTEATTAQPVSMPRQPPAFLIGQADPAAHVPTQDAVLFDQVGHGVLLPLVEPADQRRQEHSERRTRRARRESLYHRPDLRASRTFGRAMRHYGLATAPVVPSIKSMPVRASSTVASVKACAMMSPDR